jgi:hypothetical protein
MKKAVLFGVCCLLIGFLMFTSGGCKVNLTNPPYVQLDTIIGYVYTDTTLPQGSDASFFVFAARAGNDDILTTGRITRSINGGPDTTLLNMNLATTQFSNPYSFNLGPNGNKERYTFTFGNQNGKLNSVSVVIKDSL